MCSKCFREKAKTEEAASAAATALAAPAPTIVEPAALIVAAGPLIAAITAPKCGGGAAAAALPAPAPQPPAASPAAAAAAPVGPTPPEEGGAPAKKVQKNRKRCFECRKKVGYTGIECRCGFVFCGGHRYPDQHKCEFDFKTHERDNLGKVLTACKAEKLDAM